MVRRDLLAVAVAFVGVAGQAAFAGQLFSDSFTADVPNTSTLLTDGTAGNHPLLQGLDLGKKWMVRTPSTTGTNNPIVSRQYAVQVRSDDPLSLNDNYLALFRNTVTTPLASGGVFGYAHAQLSDADTTANTGHIITTTFRLYIGTGDTGATPNVSGTTGELFRLVGQPTNTIGEYNTNGDLSAAAFTNGTFGARFYKPNTIGFQTAGLADPLDTTPNPSWAFDQWNNVTLITDLSATVPFFQMTVSNSLGTKVSAKQKIWTTSGTTVGTVSLYTFNDSLVKIDDVLITNNVTVPGDFDADGDVDAADIDLLFAAPQGAVPPAPAIYDVNHDNVVDSDAASATGDATYWVKTLKSSEYGDATLDGKVNFDDLLALAQHYNTPTAGWADGNFNGQAGVNFDDLLVLAQHYGFGGLEGSVDVSVLSGDVAADFALARSLVPEPSALVILALPVVLRRRR